MAVDGDAVSQNAMRAANAVVNVVAELLASPQPIKTRLLQQRLQTSSRPQSQLTHQLKSTELCLGPVSYTHLTLPTNREV